MVNHLQTLNELLTAMSEPMLSNDIAIAGLKNHSGKVQTGDVFIAYKGHASDGKAYIAQAIENGAVAVIADEMTAEMVDLNVPVIIIDNLQQRLGELASAFWLSPSKALKIIGITATNGKTTTAYLMTQMLNKLGHRALMIGTIGTGELSNLQTSQNTTPDAIECQAIFANCVQNGIDWVVMEVSSIAVEQGRIDAVDFALSVFLNLSQDHLDYHGTMDAYAREKKRFIADFGDKKLVNADDSVGQQIIAETSNVIDFGKAAKAYRQARCSATIDGISVDVANGETVNRFSAPLLGEFNIQNLSAVCIGLLVLGFEYESVKACASKVVAPSGRVELFKKSSGQLAIVDYAHTPDALEKLLEMVSALAKGKVVAVVGCGGNRDKTKRPIMAAIAESNADVVWITSDNPRYEAPEDIANDMLQGIKVKESVFVELDRKEAIKQASESLSVDDVLVVAGKGHEQYQEIEGVRTAFSDQAVLETLGFTKMEAA